MLIGYARVSTQDQNLELQREALANAGCLKAYEDKVCGIRAVNPSRRINTCSATAIANCHCA